MFTARRMQSHWASSSTKEAVHLGVVIVLAVLFYYSLTVKFLLLPPAFNARAEHLLFFLKKKDSNEKKEKTDGCIRWGVDCSWARPKGRAARSSRPKATPSPPNDQQPISFRRPFSLSLQKKKGLACPPRLRPSPARCGQHGDARLAETLVESPESQMS